MLSKTSLFALLCSMAIPTLAAPASPEQIALVKQQFVNALITPSVLPTFNPVALLNASWATTGPISTGVALSEDAVVHAPNITIVGTDADFASGGPLNASAKYTLMMIDGNYPGSANPQGLNTHYLQYDLSLGPVYQDALTLSPTANPVIAYAGPGPAAGSGPHRYILMAFAQPSNWTAPATPAPGSSVTMINFQQYLQTAGFASPLAANYFTVAVGNPSVTVSPTSAVDVATLGFSSATGTATGTGAQSTSTSKSAATRVGINGVVGLTFSAIFAAPFIL